MKAIAINEYGGLDVLIEQDIPLREPEEGEVVVRIHSAGVNPVDWKIRAGKLADRMPNVFPITLGWDMSGTVIKRGHGARRYQVGQAVMAYARRLSIHEGTYAQYITLPECYLVAKPSTMSFEKAAALPLAGLTAYQALFDAGKLAKGQRQLIIGATGGVGTFAIQLGRIAGAEVTAVAGPSNREYAQGLGADQFIDYMQGPLEEQIPRKYPHGFDLVFDLMGGNILDKAYDYVAPGGRLVSLIGKEKPELIQGRDMSFHYVFVQPDTRELEQLIYWYIEGDLTIELQKVFNWKEVKEAHKIMQAGHTRGKVVIKVPED